MRGWRPQVLKTTQALEDLKELAASDSVDTFVLSYTSLLQARRSACCQARTVLPCWAHPRCARRSRPASRPPCLSA